jgi:hypothetical protein
MNDEKIHKFELAGLGKAPFRCVGIAQIPSASLAEHNPEGYNNMMRMVPSAYKCGTCNYCGQAIMNCYLIDSADGKHFSVGCECVRKTGDVGLVNKQKALKRQADAEKRRQKRQEAYERELDAQRQRNGGLTDHEVREKEREEKRLKNQRLLDRRIVILQGLAARMRDGRGGFRDSIAQTFAEGGLPYGGGWDITLDILAKQEGRRNSKAYDKEFNRCEEIMFKAKEIKIETIY